MAKKVYRVQAQISAEIELIADDAIDAWDRAKEIPITSADWQWVNFDVYDSYCIGLAQPEYPNAEDERHAD